MTLPEPRPGLVIRYGFLWSHEASRGALEASKDRPCAIVVAAGRQPSGDIQVVVAPTTHSPPDDVSASLEISADVCRALNLDDGDIGGVSTNSTALFGPATICGHVQESHCDTITACCRRHFSRD